MSKYKPSKHEWGTDASTKRAKELTPNESSEDGKIASGSKIVNSQETNLKINNPVAKHAKTFNKSHVMKDRKKAMKRGAVKHKGRPYEQVGEDLRKWFGKGKKGDWVRVGTDGEIKGDCARDEGEGKPKCMPRSKAHSMSKKDRGSSARRKRRADPVADRAGKGGKPVMVKTDKNESIDEKNTPTNPKLWAKFKSQAKSKFDVYPSAYANGWAAKQYKAAGGGWKTMKEEVEGVSESLSRVDIEGLGPVFVDGSPAKVKSDLRKMFKKPDYVKNVERATPSDAKKYFRGMAAGKVEEGVNEGECWDTHKKVGTKVKNGKVVNNCVPKNEDSQQTDTDLHTNASAKKPQNFKDKDGKTKVRMVPAHQDVEKESVDEFLMVKKNPMRNSTSSSSSSSSSSRSSGRKGAPSTTSGQSVTTTSGNGYKVSRNIKTGKTSKSRYNVGGSATQKESMDPRDHTDKAGHLVVVTKPGGKKMIKHYHPTSSGAQKYADRVNKTNRVGHKATVHKTDGRRIMEEVSTSTKLPRLSTMESEAISEAMSAKLRNKMKELAGGQLPRNSVELRKLKAKAQDELRGVAKAKKAAPKKQSATKTSTGKKHMGSMEAGDRNIVMQLRKAQDLKGNHDIIVSPKGRTARLPKAMIDKLLKRFDSLQKPQEKRKFQIMVTKELRKRAK